ncbi:YfjI family protein [Bythopirellula polymerisocia]|uniref:DUF3987 domain-containing protein n=1 Tax=Bythopirellula polymerisocia TaxID=2528003 RepID=A0A5C6CSR7_9BACT|nr:YfjI family protein [Bythopirellula polymerisocia]TWU27600.1 hypothetical protein Pla144_23770 [Bythopirellula polymerisocia]
MVLTTLIADAEANGVLLKVVNDQLRIGTTGKNEHWQEKLDPYREDILALMQGEPLTEFDESAEFANCVSVSAYKPFPIHCLPGPVRKYVSAAAQAIGCDAASIALPMLCCLARTVGNARAIRLKETWTEPAILWGAIVGKSGTHKTPALQSAMKFLERIQAKSIANHAEALQQYSEDNAVWERAYDAWKHDKKTSEPPPIAPPEPVCIRFTTSDCTIEALTSLLATQFDGLLVSRDELSGWLGGIGEYKNGRGSDLGHWLASWSGAPLTVDRKTGPIKMLHIPRASVSLLGGIQPGILRKAIAREHMQDGLCARLLFVMPEARKVVWSDATVHRSMETAIEDLFEKLLTLEPTVNDEGESEPLPLDLTTEAKSLWVQYFNRHRAELIDLDDDSAAAWSKLEAYTARFALIIQLCRWAAGEASGDSIDEASMSMAIELSDWFGGETKRVYGLFVENENEREQRELVELIRRKGGTVVPRDLMRSGRKFKNASDAEAALVELEASGIGSWSFDDHAGGRGRPTRRFTLVDTVDSDTNNRKHEENGISVSVNTVNTPPRTLSDPDVDGINRLLAESVEDTSDDIFQPILNGHCQGGAL